jgi:hypothetical protein
LDPSDVSIFLTDQLSPTSVVVNIHSSALRQLFTFQATHHPGDRWQISPRTLIDSASAIPIYSTRPNVADTLTLDPGGSLRLLTSFTQSLPLFLPVAAEGEDMAHILASSLHMRLETDKDESMRSAMHQASIIGLEQGNGGDFVAIMRHGEKLRWSADFTSKKRLTRCAMGALSYAWPAEALFALKRAILYDSTGDEWTRFALALRTAFGLNRPEPSATPIQRVVRQSLDSRDPLVARLAAKCRARGTVTFTEIGFGPEEAEAQSASLDPDLIPLAIMALHLVGQDCRLSLSARADLSRVAGLLLDLTGAVGRVDWWDYWMRIVPSTSVCPSATRKSTCPFLR